MMLDLEILSYVIIIIGGVVTFVWTLIKISEWYKKGKVTRPNIILEYNNDYKVSRDSEVTTYNLSAKNVGEVTAENVEIRLNKVIQESDSTLIEDRYIVGKFDFINVGDSHRFNFIQDYIGREGIEDCLLTPGGRDRKFPRENGEFTFLISGKNLALKTVTMLMEWDGSLSKWSFHPYIDN